jgi:hypothetical protein
MRKAIIGLLVASAIVPALTSCTKSEEPPPSSPAIGFGSQLSEATDVFGILRLAGLACPKPKVVGRAAMCGPVGDTNLTVSAAVYSSPTEARQQLQAHCSGDTWNLFRTGQNWRAALSTSNGETIDPSQARAVAAALRTDLIHGCPQG